MNSNKMGELLRKAFVLKRILNKKLKKIDFMNFFENIGGKILEMGKRSQSSYVCRVDSAYRRSVKKLWLELKTKIVGTAATTLVVISICGVVNLLDWGLGYEVIVDGENIGMVTDKTVVLDAICEVGEEIKIHLGENSHYEKEPVFVQRIVSKDCVKQSKHKNNNL